MMPEPVSSPRWSASQASRCSAVRSRTTARCSDSRSSGPRSTSTSPCWSEAASGGASCSATSPGHPRVGGRGGGQHRDAGRQVGEHRADPAVVGPEVVAPVGDAVRLVDHEQAGALGQLGQHVVAEAGVVEPLGADQQHVDLAGGDLRLDAGPVLGVGRVDGDRADAGPLGGVDLVAHQREQRRDDHGRPGALRAQQRGGHEVDRRLAPAGALHDQRPAPVDDQRLDRGPLVLAQLGVVPADQRAEVPLGGGPRVSAAGCVDRAASAGAAVSEGMPACLPAPADGHGAPSPGPAA